jgi:hypothetical protein
LLKFDIVRDFKTFTSKQIISSIKEEPESRRERIYSNLNVQHSSINEMTTIRYGRMKTMQLSLKRIQ